MEWSVFYYQGSLPLVEYASNDTSWESLPTENVAYVVFTHGGYAHRLQGMDNYWVDGNTYGMYNDSENFEIYDGAQSCCYRWGDDRHEFLGEYVPDEQHIIHIRGVTLPDDDARQVGIL